MTPTPDRAPDEQPSGEVRQATLALWYEIYGYNYDSTKSFLDNQRALEFNKMYTALDRFRTKERERCKQIALELRDKIDARGYTNIDNPEHSLGQGFAANYIAKCIGASR